MREHPATSRHLLGIGTAIAVFLTLTLVKLGAFFIVHAGIAPRHALSNPATERTAQSVTR